MECVRRLEDVIQLPLCHSCRPIHHAEMKNAHTIETHKKKIDEFDVNKTVKEKDSINYING